MTAPFFTADPVPAPGLHALVVGVSDYPNLPADGAPPPPGGAHKNTLGLTKLEGAALGAFRVARWLRDHAAALTPPLASVRLLLAPTAAERGLEPELAALAAPPPTLANLGTAAAEWRAAAGGHADNVTLFYFAGHGVQRKVGDHVLLLHEFGAPGLILGTSAASTNLFDGMRVPPGDQKAARRQLYFYDACKLEPDLFREYEDVPTGAVLDVPKVPVDARRYGVFYSTLPGRAAYGWRAGHSLFCEALLRCLDGAAATPPDVDSPNDPLPWRVTAHTLRLRLPGALAAVAAAAGQTQEIDGPIGGADFDLRTFKTPPKVPVGVAVNPGRARHCIRVALRTAAGATALDVAPSLPGDPMHDLGAVEAGSYFYNATDCGNPRAFVDHTNVIISAHPPRKLLRLDFAPAAPAPAPAAGT